ncbi:MAG: bifunctional phosphoserine phosphatase/homoserine phosphotransferase ThrH [Pelagibacterales bacterium]|nr:bifunctional phosphoserine phosphatase/homoserine phosphotransferase ThrH [Pelagibacterales bacterium]|tara:strand:+ start:2594 stop:3187 length:594 start_codon:yes stop_codon:yes gene_type:complete
MRIICLDLEGVLVPEIWISLANRTNIKELLVTTRDIEDYNELMTHRLNVLKKEGLTIKDVNDAVSTLKPFEGAKNLLDKLSLNFQVIILSDTFYEIAGPLFNQLGNPNVFCHHLEISNSGTVEAYRLRIEDQKTRAVKAFKELGFSVAAAGDSYNDLGMLMEADISVLFKAPEFLIDEYKSFHHTDNYDVLYDLLSN